MNLTPCFYWLKNGSCNNGDNCPNGPHHPECKKAGVPDNHKRKTKPEGARKEGKRPKGGKKKEDTKKKEVNFETGED